MRLEEINSKNWSLSTEEQGAVVQSLDNINQCIRIILMTRKGSNPLRPDFGCTMFDYIDKPQNVAIPNIMRAISKAIEEFETRVEIASITAEIIDSGIKFNIEWEFSGLTSSTSITL